MFFEAAYKLDLAERPSQVAGSLSGGKQQIVAIGRALMASPRVLLMDEPSLGLAPVVVDEVFATIGTINAAGVSVLLVEQNVDRALRLATRGYLLSEGRVVLEGTTADLGRSDLTRRTVLGLQAAGPVDASSPSLPGGRPAGLSLAPCPGDARR